MKHRAGPDHLASSLTDLMTSLMVIFILLLLVFLNNRASQQAVMVRDLAKDLQSEFHVNGFTNKDIHQDPKDPGTLLLIVPDRVMNFAPNESKLKPEGEAFIKSRIPQLAQALADPKYRSAIESIIVEGHTDKTRPRGLAGDDGEQWNLQLSQDRSLEVVKQSLSALSGFPDLRLFFFDKLSASGRGESDPANPDVPDAEENRRVVFKIRIKSDPSLKSMQLPLAPVTNG